MKSFSDRYKTFLKWFDPLYRELDLPRTPNSFYDPIRYHLQGKGKRLRPAILTETALVLGARREDVLPAALAMELLHNFTLIHDDIMDHDETRHGLATIHVKWDVNTAILAGDGLFALAFMELEKLSDRWYRPISRLFREKILAVCEGQSYDMEFEKAGTVSQGHYFRMVRLKTAELLSAAMTAGAILGNADEKTVMAVNEFGIRLGIVFQIQDDMLELTSSSEEMGKSLDSDIQAGKKTFPLIFARELAEKDGNKELLNLLNRHDYSDREIEALKDVFRQPAMREGIMGTIHSEIAKLEGLTLEMNPHLAAHLQSFSQFILNRKK